VVVVGGDAVVVVGGVVAVEAGAVVVCFVVVLCTAFFCFAGVAGGVARSDVDERPARTTPAIATAMSAAPSNEASSGFRDGARR
jgi:hypothetical protein